MFIYLSFFLIIKNLFCQENYNTNDINDKELISFNNNFDNMFFEKKYFITYLGTEMSYFKINSPIAGNNNTIINYNNREIELNFKNKNETFIINSSFIVSYLGEKKIKFENEAYIFIFHYVDYNDSTTTDNNNKTTYNIYYDKKNKIEFFISNVENIFVKYNFLSFILIVSGCFSILYGAYHFMFGYVIHLTFFLYFSIFEFFGIYLDNVNVLASTLSLFFFFIFSLSLSPVLKTDKKDNNKYLFLKAIYGCSFGFSTFKILSYYYIFFNLEPITNGESRRLVYIAFSVILIGIGFIFNLFNPFKKYIFLPCSAVSGSYYITKGLSYIVGGYFSNIIAIKEGLQFNYLKNRKEIISTYFIFIIILIIFSVYFQIKHVEYKQTEMEEFFINEEPLSKDDSCISNASNTSGIIKKGEEEELIEKDPFNKEKEEDDEGNEDIEIDDQED